MEPPETPRISNMSRKKSKSCVVKRSLSISSSTSSICKENSIILDSASSDAIMVDDFCPHSLPPVDNHQYLDQSTGSLKENDNEMILMDDRQDSEQPQSMLLVRSNNTIDMGTDSSGIVCQSCTANDETIDNDNDDIMFPLFMEGLPKDFTSNPALAAIASLFDDDNNDDDTDDNTNGITVTSASFASNRETSCEKEQPLICERTVEFTAAYSPTSSSISSSLSSPNNDTSTPPPPPPSLISTAKNYHNNDYVWRSPSSHIKPSSSSALRTTNGGSGCGKMIPTKRRKKQKIGTATNNFNHYNDENSKEKKRSQTKGATTTTVSEAQLFLKMWKL